MSRECRADNPGDVSRETSRTPDPVDVTRLQALAREIPVELEKRHAEALLRHLDAVLERNATMNLTAIRDHNKGIRFHVVDSLIALKAIAHAKGEIVDIGTGAGYPGIPIAIVSDRRITLLEPTKKKAAFLSEVLMSLGLEEQATVLAERAEEHALARGGAYGAVVARAVSDLGALVELASPLLEKGGILVAMKGAIEAEELARGRAVGLRVGLSEQDVLRTQLPGGGEARTLVTYRKSGLAKLKLPRRPGMAQKHPLK